MSHDAGEATTALDQAATETKVNRLSLLASPDLQVKTTRTQSSTLNVAANPETVETPPMQDYGYYLAFDFVDSV
jgi:hypothetical protein